MSADRLATLRQFVADDPADPFNHYALALEHASRGETGTAIARLADALAADARYVAAYHQLGLLFAASGRKADARQAFDEGIRIAGEAGDAHAASEMREARELLES